MQKEENEKRRMLTTFSESVSPKHIHDLYNIFYTITGFASHGLKGDLRIIVSFSQFLRKALDEMKLNFDKSDLNSEKINEMFEFISDASRYAVHYINILFSNTYTENGTRIIEKKYFSAKPIFFLNDIIRINSSLKILIETENHESIEILYPENVLIGIINELIVNAKKAGSNTILIQWSLKDFWFRCSVHDNGDGGTLFKDDLKNPISSICQSRGGLSFIERIISESNGFSYLKKSNKLSGLAVNFEFPIKVYYSKEKGTVYAD